MRVACAVSADDTEAIAWTVASLTATANSPPEGGRLAVMPRQGIADRTTFLITHSSPWLDEHLPLSYSFGFSLGGVETCARAARPTIFLHNYPIFTDSFSTVMPMSGVAAKQPDGSKQAHVVTVVVEVTDNLGASVRCGDHRLSTEASAPCQSVTVKPDPYGVYSVKRIKQMSQAVVENKVSPTDMLLTILAERSRLFPHAAVAGPPTINGHAGVSGPTDSPLQVQCPAGCSGHGVCERSLQPPACTSLSTCSVHCACKNGWSGNGCEFSSDLSLKLKAGMGIWFSAMWAAIWRMTWVHGACLVMQNLASTLILLVADVLPALSPLHHQHVLAILAVFRGSDIDFPLTIHVTLFGKKIKLNVQDILGAVKSSFNTLQSAMEKVASAASYIPGLDSDTREGVKDNSKQGNNLLDTATKAVECAEYLVPLLMGSAVDVLPLLAMPALNGKQTPVQKAMIAEVEAWVAYAQNYTRTRVGARPKEHGIASSACAAQSIARFKASATVRSGMRECASDGSFCVAYPPRGVTCNTAANETVGAFELSLVRYREPLRKAVGLDKSLVSSSLMRSIEVQTASEELCSVAPGKTFQFSMQQVTRCVYAAGDAMCGF